MKRVLMVLGILSSFVGYSQSNWHFGPTFGIGASQINFLGNDDQLKMLPSFYLGAEGNVPLTKHFLFRTQLRYSIKGVERNSYTSDRSMRIRVHYLEIPAKISLDFGKVGGFILTSGLYLGKGVWGKLSEYGQGGETIKIKFDGVDTFDPPTVHYARWEYGWILNIGYKTKNTLIDLGLNEGINGVYGSDSPANLTFRLGFSIVIDKKDSDRL